MDDQLFQAETQKTKFTYIGTEKADNTEYQKLKLVYVDSTTGFDSAIAYLDAKTYYLIKLTTYQKVNGVTNNATTVFSDFRTEQGVTRPYLMTINIPNTKAIPLKIEKLLYNAPLVDTLFTRPKDSYAPPQP